MKTEEIIREGKKERFKMKSKTDSAPNLILLYAIKYLIVIRPNHD